LFIYLHEHSKHVLVYNTPFSGKQILQILETTEGFTIRGSHVLKNTLCCQHCDWKQ